MGRRRGAKESKDHEEIQPTVQGLDLTPDASVEAIALTAYGSN